MEEVAGRELRGGAALGRRRRWRVGSWLCQPPNHRETGRRLGGAGKAQGSACGGCRFAWTAVGGTGSGRGADLNAKIFPVNENGQPAAARSRRKMPPPDSDSTTPAVRHDYPVGRKKMSPIPQPFLAAGFLEVTDTPEMFLTAVVISAAYVCMLAIPATYLLRRLERKKWKKEMVAGLIFTAVAPLLFRAVAMAIQGRGWSDWHFIWLYLLASASAAGVYFFAIFVWSRLKESRANQPLQRTPGKIPFPATEPGARRR